MFKESNMVTNTALFSESYMIPSDTPDIQLHVLHKRLHQHIDFGEARTLLMMHGATYSSGSLFDTPVEGQSFMDYLAGAGYDVYAVDVRGYGHSTRPVEMTLPAELNPPAVRTETAVRDFSSAVDFILRARSLQRLNIIGMSWGGSVTGAFTARNNHKVRRLGLIAPQWLSSTPVPLDHGGELGAWRLVNAQAAQVRWLQAAPVDKREGLIPAGAFAAWLQHTRSTEPDATLRADNSLRANNGPIQDIREFWAAGKPFYDPADIQVPVILVHGEWDVDVPIALAQDWFLHATGAPIKRWVEIGEATHMMILEKNRHQVYDALLAFMA